MAFPRSTLSTIPTPPARASAPTTSCGRSKSAAAPACPISSTAIGSSTAARCPTRRISSRSKASATAPGANWSPTKSVREDHPALRLPPVAAAGVGVALAPLLDGVDQRALQGAVVKGHLGRLRALSLQIRGEHEESARRLPDSIVAALTVSELAPARAGLPDR